MSNFTHFADFVKGDSNSGQLLHAFRNRAFTVLLFSQPSVLHVFCYLVKLLNCLECILVIPFCINLPVVIDRM